MNSYTDLALLGGVFIGLMVFILVTAVFYIVCTWRIMVKAGEEGWKSLIPVYGSYVLCKIIFGNGWFFLIAFIPYVNFIFVAAESFMLARAFGKDQTMQILAAIFPYIFIPIIAFGSAVYQGAVKWR